MPDPLPGALHPGQGLRDPWGVNVYGHLGGEFGLAESARVYVRALMCAGIPVALNDLDRRDVPHAFGDRTFPGAMAHGAPYATSIFFVNPDHMDSALELAGDALEGRMLVGCWFWELEQIPDSWHRAINAVDAIVVASTHVEKAFRRATGKPVIRVPLPLREVSESPASRRDFGLPEDAFVFLASFDFNSSIHRKNPAAAIAAFQQAFPIGQPGVRLLLKSSNGHRYRNEMLALLAGIANDPRIMLRDQVLPMEHMRALQRCADAYVSLHRAEGFGLGMAECMAMGKPVIATAWSGNLDFMDAGNSCLVGFRLVPVESGEYPHGDGARWAEPDIGDAAAWMKRLVAEPALAARIGRQAATDVRVRLSPQAAVDALADGIRSAALEVHP